MATTLIYNGVTLKNVQTDEFSQEIRRDPSNTDPIMHIITLRVRCLLHASDAALLHGVDLSGGGSAASTAAAMQQLQTLLGQDRGTLQFTVGDADVLTVLPNNDLDNGPKVESLKVTNIRNFTYAISFGVKVSVAYCNGKLLKNAASSDFTQQVLSNRWSLSDTIDENNRTTRIWRGQARFKGISPSPHSFRHFLVPSLLKGYRRMRQNFVTDPNGLDFSYEIQDQRAHAAPPEPATDWTATHTEITESNGAINHAEVNVWMKGEDGVNRRDLIAAAITVCEARLGSLAANSVSDATSNPGSFLVEQARIVDNMDKPEVSVSYRVKRTAPAGDFASFSNLLLGEHLETGKQPLPNYAHDEFPLIKAYDGVSPANIFQQHLNDICSPGKPIATPDGELSVSGTDQSAAEGEEPVFTQSSNSLPTFSGFKVSTGHAENVYTFYSGSSYYKTDSGKIVLPIANTSNETSETAKVIRVRNKIVRRIVQIRAERTGKWPEMPRPETIALQGGNHELLNHDLLCEFPEVSANGGSYVFRCELKAEYVLTTPPGTSDNLRVGAPATGDFAKIFEFDQTTDFVDPTGLI